MRLASLRWAVLGIGCAVAAGCAQFPSVPYNRAAPNRPASVALAPVWAPEKPQVFIVGAVGNNFGLIGALVEVSRAASAATTAQEVMQAAEFDYRSALKDRVVAAFEEAGFAVVRLEGERPARERIKFLKVVPAAGENDAVADLAVTFLGFVAGGATTPYRPTLNVQLRLLEAKTSKVLFAEQIHYNHFDPIAPTAVALEPKAECTFDNQDALKADPPKAAACLQDAIEAVAAEITRQLRSPEKAGS